MSEEKSVDSVSERISNDDTVSVNKLRSALEFTCKKFLAGIKFSFFKKGLKEIYKSNPKSLLHIHDQLNIQMTESIAADIDELCKEHSIELLLNSLDSIKKAQDSAQSSWRPSGNPEEDLRDHIYPIKMRHKEALQDLLRKLEISNEELINEVTVNHAEIMHIKKANEDLYDDFSNIITSFTGSNLQNFQNAWMNIVDEE